LRCCAAPTCGSSGWMHRVSPAHYANSLSLPCTAHVRSPLAPHMGLAQIDRHSATFRPEVGRRQCCSYRDCSPSPSSGAFGNTSERPTSDVLALRDASSLVAWELYMVLCTPPFRAQTLEAATSQSTHRMERGMSPHKLTEPYHYEQLRPTEHDLESLVIAIPQPQPSVALLSLLSWLFCSRCPSSLRQ
jgi:hypothetical protein